MQRIPRSIESLNCAASDALPGARPFKNLTHRPALGMHGSAKLSPRAGVSADQHMTPTCLPLQTSSLFFDCLLRLITIRSRLHRDRGGRENPLGSRSLTSGGRMATFRILLLAL